MSDHDTYTQADDRGIETPGHDCENCGKPGFEHHKKQVDHSDGRRQFEMRCHDE